MTQLTALQVMQDAPVIPVIVLNDIAHAVPMAMVSRLKRLSSMPGMPCVTPSHMAGTPPATCTVAPSARACSRMSSG